MKTSRPGGPNRSGEIADRFEARSPGKHTLVETLAEAAATPSGKGPNKTRVPTDRSPSKPEQETHAPLDGSKAQQFGARLGADFSSVQVHAGDGVANDHGAAAVAFGRDIHFADGMLGGGASDALLGHELVHAVQQGAVPTHDNTPLGKGTSAVAEIEADKLGAAAARGVTGRVTVGAPPGVQRKPRHRPAGPDASSGDGGEPPATKVDALLAKPAVDSPPRSPSGARLASPAGAGDKSPVSRIGVEGKPTAKTPAPSGAHPARPATTPVAHAAGRSAGSRVVAAPRSGSAHLASNKARPELAPFAPHVVPAAAPLIASARPAPEIRATAPSAAIAQAFITEGQQHAAQIRTASRATAASIRARVASEVAHLYAEHMAHGAALDAHFATAHGTIIEHEQSAHGVLQSGRTAAHAHLAATGQAQTARVEHTGQQQRALTPQVIEQHSAAIDAHTTAESTRFEQGASARTQQVQQSGGGGDGETADKHAEATSKIGARAAANFASDSSKVERETQRAAGEFRGHLDEGAANFTGSVDHMVSQFTGGIASAVSATQAGADSIATQAGAAFSSFASQAGSRLEDHTVAARDDLQQGTETSVAAIQAHGEPQATQIEADGERIAAAVVEQTHTLAPMIADAPVEHSTVMAGEARTQLSLHAGQATTQIDAAGVRVGGGITAHATASSAALAQTSAQVSAHLQTGAAKVGQQLAQAGAHTAAGLQTKAQTAGQQIQESAGQATDHLDRAGTDFSAKAQQASAGARTSIASSVDTASADQQANVGTFTSKQRDASSQIDAKHDQLKSDADQRSAADQAQNAAQAQTFLDWFLPKSWTDTIKRWFADTFGKWWGGFLWGVLNALLVVAVVVAVCVIFPVAAPFIVGGLLVAGAAAGIYSRFKMYEAYHDGNGPGFWEGLGLVGLGITDVTGIPSIVEGLVGSRAFSNGHKMDPFDAGESVGTGLVNLIALIVGGARTLRSKPGGVNVKPLKVVPEGKSPEVPPEVRPPEVTPPEGKLPEGNPAGSPPRTFGDLLGRLSARAQEAVAQQRQLRSPENMQQMENIGRNPDGTYDVSKANQAWERKWMDDARFQRELAKGVSELTAKARSEIERIKNTCEDNDGTNRPNATVGDGTTEAALVEEARTGQPVGGVGGHAEKAATAIRTLQEAVASLEHLKPSVASDPGVTADITAAIARANQRISALQGGLDVWNNRATLYPRTWYPSGQLRGPVGPVAPVPPHQPDDDHPDGGASP